MVPSQGARHRLDAVQLGGWLATGLLIAAILGSTHVLGRTWQAVAVAVAAGVAYLITILLTRGAPDRSNPR